MRNGQRIDPDSPSAILDSNCVMQQNGEHLVDQLTDLDLLGRGRENVGQRD